VKKITKEAKTLKGEKVDKKGKARENDPLRE
jgi:hypothetical protein